MAKNSLSLIGKSISEFNELIDFKSENREIMVRPARLIPAQKKLDELSLASVFLASLTMITEFRDMIFKEIGISKIGYIKAYTEISFPKIKIYEDGIMKKGPLRIDGLILQVVSGKIKDAAFFEMKMGSQEVQSKQIGEYLSLAKEVGVTKLVSISNQFVSTPKDYPIPVDRVKGIDLFHFSWRYIMALGSVLLIDNDLNISDPDQVLIMNEVMEFFRNKNTAVNTFDSMSKEWSQVIDGVRAKNEFSKIDPILAVCAQDWLQEEQDLALKMSEELGLMVDCNKKRSQSMQERLDSDINDIIESGCLFSQFKIKGAVSPLEVIADLGYRKIICTVEVRVPLDKKSASARLNWLNRQIESIRGKYEKTFLQIKSSLWLEAMVKGREKNKKKLYSNLEALYEESLQCDIRSVKISYEPELAGKFNQTKKFIEEYEKIVVTFYSVVVQNLKNWEEPAPKMNTSEVVVLEEINE